jgi:hypothetical protein
MQQEEHSLSQLLMNKRCNGELKLSKMEGLRRLKALMPLLLDEMKFKPEDIVD